MNEIYQNLKLTKLTEKNEYFDMLVAWFYNWWGKEEGWTEEEMVDYLTTLIKPYANPNNIFDIPEIYIATYNDELVGTFSFAMRDLDYRADLYPWLINLYVDEEYRGKGVSKFLITKAIEITKKKNIKEFYVYTTHESLYEKYGFKFIELVRFYDSQKTPYQRLYKYDLRDVNLL